MRCYVTLSNECVYIEACLLLLPAATGQLQGM